MRRLTLAARYGHRDRRAGRAPALAEGTVTAADADQPAADQGPDAAQALAPVRFLLTFDDGPDSGPDGSTPVILRQLANNPITPGIKAVFFVQTAHRRRGGSPEAGADARHLRGRPPAGRAQRPARRHVPHTRLTPEKLADSLRSGEADIVAQCGHVAPVVRPPDWAHNDATEAVYHQLGLDMLMADANARDGKIYGWHISLRRRSHMVSELERLAAPWPRTGSNR
jgi:peptidoglycan/xylan/chitin deacetylase (PgdA/CDA1 family)